MGSVRSGDWDQLKNSRVKTSSLISQLQWGRYQDPGNVFASGWCRHHRLPSPIQVTTSALKSVDLASLASTSQVILDRLIHLAKIASGAPQPASELMGTECKKLNVTVIVIHSFDPCLLDEIRKTIEAVHSYRAPCVSRLISKSDFKCAINVATPCRAHHPRWWAHCSTHSGPFLFISFGRYHLDMCI